MLIKCAPPSNCCSRRPQSPALDVAHYNDCCTRRAVVCQNYYRPRRPDGTARKFLTCACLCRARAMRTLTGVSVRSMRIPRRRSCAAWACQLAVDRWRHVSQGDWLRRRAGRLCNSGVVQLRRPAHTVGATRVRPLPTGTNLPAALRRRRLRATQRPFVHVRSSGPLGRRWRVRAICNATASDGAGW